jgi:hypothetical protein
MIRIPVLAAACAAIVACNAPRPNNQEPAAPDKWSISILPSSVRLDPVSNKIIENRFKGVKTNRPEEEDLLKKNWIYDGQKATLQSARGEYVSYQLVITSHTDSTIEDISIDVPAFSGNGSSIDVKPELFLEWSVKVKTPSTGYPVASLNKGWYPDALIPLDEIQYDSSKVHGRWTYPLWIPDFNNRIENQRSLIVWVDQFVPNDSIKAKAGKYTTEVAVTINKRTKKIPVELEVWNFAIPNENKLKASLQEEGFMSSMDEKRELEVYQLFKRNRVALMDPTYQPQLAAGGGKARINWNSFDERLKKYLTGEAFTSKYGYQNGPGYGEPLETFILPFDVYGKHGTPGWPDIGKPDVERNPSNREIYVDAVKQVRSHLQPMVNPDKTELIVYLNGLDESYFQEALDRMVYFGNLFKEYYPEVNFRIDGGYSDTAMEYVHKSIRAWASHTINYDIDKVRKYQQMGIHDWLYGPLLYESKVNSWVGSSTILDLPLLNDRAISWACWKYRTYSWISWGIGYSGKSAWYDPETWKDAYKHGADSDPQYTYKKINGSALLIYAPGIVPNVTTYCPSIRLKAMRNGVQEYEYMRLLAALDKNNARADEVVNSIIKQPFGAKSIGNLDVWSFDAENWDKARVKLGTLINEIATK